MGIDWMCGACENDDPDLTVREAHRRVMREAVKYWESFDRLVGVYLSVGEPIEVARKEAAKLVDQDGNGNETREVRCLRWLSEDRDEIAAVANGPDDDDYLARLHGERLRAAREFEQGVRAPKIGEIWRDEWDGPMPAAAGAVA